MNILNTQCNRLVKKQSGLSLIELLIAMLIGLFLLVGITTSYLSSKKSSIVRDHVSILEDNGRAALEILTNTLQHTGYRSTDLDLLENPFMATQPLSSSCGTGITSVLAPTNFPAGNENNDAGDTISVFYLGDDEINTDCAGGVLPSACRVGANVDSNAHRIFNAFFIDADNNLQCAGSQTAELQTIAEGVENIQILYGLNTDDDEFQSVERYVNASDIGINDWGQVVSIQVAILVRTLIQVKSQPETQSFSLLDKDVDSPNDRFQRAVFSTSINLRNL